MVSVASALQEAAYRRLEHLGRHELRQLMAGGRASDQLLQHAEQLGRVGHREPGKVARARPGRARGRRRELALTAAHAAAVAILRRQQWCPAMPMLRERLERLCVQAWHDWGRGGTLAAPGHSHSLQPPDNPPKHISRRARRELLDGRGVPQYALRSVRHALTHGSPFAGS